MDQVVRCWLLAAKLLDVKEVNRWWNTWPNYYPDSSYSKEVWMTKSGGRLGYKAIADDLVSRATYGGYHPDDSWQEREREEGFRAASRYSRCLDLLEGFLEKCPWEAFWASQGLNPLIGGGNMVWEEKSSPGAE